MGFWSLFGGSFIPSFFSHCCTLCWSSSSGWTIVGHRISLSLWKRMRNVSLQCQTCVLETHPTTCHKKHKKFLLTFNIGRKSSGELLAPITVIKNGHPDFALSKDDMGSTSTLKHANEINIYSIMRYLLWPSISITAGMQQAALY